MKLIRHQDPVIARNLDEIQDRLTSRPFEILSTAPSNPREADTYYDSTLKKVRTWDGTQWNNHW